MSYLLWRGMKSPLVTSLKAWLNRILEPSPNLNTTSEFDQKTFDAVVRFQKLCSLTPDGKVGLDTWGMLGKEVGSWDLPLEVIWLLPNWLKKLVTGKPQVPGGMAFSPSTFFGMYMHHFGGLSQGQVDGLKFLLTAIELDPDVNDIRGAAYMLATVKWECDDTWQPIEEGGKGAGYPYGVPVKVKDNSGKEYTNTYYGRGYVQLTWKDNYQKMSLALNLGDQLLIHPEKALDPEIAYQIMSYGMRKGSFTGKKLSDFISGDQCDYKNARKSSTASTSGRLSKSTRRNCKPCLQASLSG